MFLSGKGVVCCGYNFGYVENRVAFDGSGEVQLIFMARYLLGNLKVPQSFEIEFGRGACGLNVLAEEPDFISDLVSRGG